MKLSLFIFPDGEFPPMAFCIEEFPEWLRVRIFLKVNYSYLQLNV